MPYYGGFPPYVPVASQRAQAHREMEKLRKKGTHIQPVEIPGRKITTTFWGTAWCDHLDGFHDFSNRLPRGRRYVRNGSVCHLDIKKGEIKAIVSGSELYNISVDIKPLPKTRWKKIKRDCAGQVGSLLELLQGRFSEEVMQVVTHHDRGMFPQKSEIQFDCDCPDWALMCKHVAAVFYGIGARLDTQPELLFTLRGVDHEELIHTETTIADSLSNVGGKNQLTDDLGDIFGIEIVDTKTPPKKTRRKKTVKKKTPAKKAPVKKTPVKKTPVKKAPAKKTPVKKTPVKKTSVKKTSVKKTPVKKTPVKKTPVKKTPAN